jgi:hypothetical protein
MKTCAYAHCDTEFVPTGSKKYCSKQCQQGAWASGHRAEINAQNARNKTTQILSRLKFRAKAQGIAFDLDRSDIIIPDVCPVLGIKLTWNQGRGYHPDSPSVDKIDPSRGYVKGNVRVISARANLLKNDATVEELTAVLKDLNALRY